jgi:Cu-processing system permease protein
MAIWFLLYVLYDSLLMLLVIFFGDYPLQHGILVMTLFNPIDTMRSIVLMQGNLQSLMTLTSAVYAKVLTGYTGITIGTIVLTLQAAVAAFLGLRLYRKRDL